MTATRMKKIQGTQHRIQSQENAATRKLLRGYLHKTSNSLCGIRGYAGLIAEREMAGSLAGKWAGKILCEIDRMEEIFRSVGDMARVCQPFRSGCDLPGVLQRVKNELASINPNMTIKISPAPEGQLLLPEADLALVLKEILKNSHEAKQDVAIQVNGQIGISGRVVLCISDNGPGMSPELLKLAADPFVTTRDGHHGVGLTRVETILDMHGLAWSLTSRSGLGTTATMEVAEALNWNPEIV